jgi:tetratricopeptide (TPR) repeat protein
MLSRRCCNRSGSQWANLLVLAIVLASSAVPAHSQTSAGDPLQGTNSPFAERYTEIVRSGEALAKAHNYVGALQEYDKALALGPPTPLAHSTLLTYRADALWHLGRSAEALTDQNRAVEIDPNAFALWARGETLRKRKRYADAPRDNVDMEFNGQSPQWASGPE